MSEKGGKKENEYTQTQCSVCSAAVANQVHWSICLLFQGLPGIDGKDGTPGIPGIKVRMANRGEGKAEGPVCHIMEVISNKVDEIGK